MFNLANEIYSLYHPPQPKLPRWLIVAVFIIVLMILWIAKVRATEIQWDKYSNEQIVEAIGKAENSVKFPYGIKSIPTYGDKELARKYCLNSVRNGRRRWINAGRPDDLIVYISRRYCPISDCPKLNKNWTKNIKYFLDRIK